MSDSPTVERRDPQNAQLRNFIEWLEKSRFYGKFTGTVRAGKIIALETQQTHRLEDFNDNLSPDVGSAT